jgi:TonB-dependent receptor
MALFAAGSIRGNITDAQTKDPLPYTNVMLKGTSLGAAADENGDYIIQNIPAGTYTLLVRYVGYKEKSIPLSVSDGKTVQLNIQLESETVMGETVVVTAQAEGQMHAINEQLSSTSIKNVVSSARIQEVPDANAAESIGRLPGVSVLREGGEGNKVVIRGLSPKFNNITVDGVKMGGTGMNETNKVGSALGTSRSDIALNKVTDRSADLSMISPNMLEGIEVVKAITPDMDAEALGGSVNFKLKEAESGLHYDLSALGGYNNLKDSYGDYKFSGNVNTRFFDDKLGVLVQGDFERRDRSSNEENAGYGWEDSPRLGQFNPLILTSLSLSSINRDKRRGGGLLVLDYKLPNGKLSSTNLYSRTNSTILNWTEINNNNTSEKLYNFTESHTQINVFTNKVQYEGDFGLLHVDTRLSHSYSENDEPENYFANFRQSGGFNKVDPTLHPSLILPQIVIDLANTDLYDLKKFTNNSKDREITGNLDLSYPFNISDVTTTLKIGGKYRYKDRSYKHTEAGGNVYYSGKAVNDAIVAAYPWMAESYAANGTLPIALFWDENEDIGDIFGGDYYLIGKTSANLLKDAVNIGEKYGTLESWSVNAAANTRFNYSGNEYAAAGYMMADINVGKQIQLIPGFRYEHLRTKYTAPHGNSAYAGNIYPHIDTTADERNGYFLPIVHARYKPVDWFDIRLAYTNTLSYPDFSAIIPLIDIGTNRVLWNNPNLKAARSQNYDVYMSFYENTLGLLTIGGFYKDVKDVIIPWYTRKIIDPADFEGVPAYTKGYYVDTYVNNPYKSTIKGIEIDWQTRFWYLPGVLSGLVLNINYTHITSETKYPLTKFDHVVIDDEIVETVVDTFYANRMLEQPDDIINVSLGYDLKGFSINVSMIYQANIFKTNNFWEEQWAITDDYLRFDVALKQNLPFFGMQLFANINNINGAKDATLMNGNSFPSAEQEYDMTMDLGLRMRL